MTPLRLKKETVVILSLYALFSVFYSFFMAGFSFYNMDGDICAIGSWLYRDVYKDLFLRDPYIPHDNTYYLASHLFILKVLFWLTGSYIGALKSLLCIQIFLTLCFTTYAYRQFFPEASLWKTAALASFVSLVYIKIPQVENVGFYSLRSATARSSFAVFIPLLILFYWQNKSLKIWKLSIPNIIWLSLLTGFLAYLHPQTGIMLFFVFFVHFLLFRFKKSGFKIKDALLPFSIFLFLLFFFFDAIARASYHVSLLGYFREFFLKFSFSSEFDSLKARLFDPSCIWYLQLTYIPYIFLVILLPFFDEKKIMNPQMKSFFIFLRRCFFIAFFLHIALGGLGYNVKTLSAFGVAQIFMRGSRVAFFFMETFAVFFILYGNIFLSSRKLRLFLYTGILFFLFMLSGSRLEINPVCSSYVGLSPVYLTLIVRLISIALLLVLLIISKGKEFRHLIIGGYCVAILFSWPLLCGCIKMKAGEILDSCSGFGSWRLFAIFANSKTSKKMDNFDDLSNWIRKNTPQNSLFFYLMRPSYGHKLKLASLRPGFGDSDEIGAGRSTSLSQFLAQISRKAIEDFKRGRALSMFQIIEDYKVDYLIVEKSEYANVLPVLSGKYSKAFCNDNYLVLKVTESSNKNN